MSTVCRETPLCRNDGRASVSGSRYMYVHVPHGGWFGEAPEARYDGDKLHLNSIAFQFLQREGIVIGTGRLRLFLFEIPSSSGWLVLRVKSHNSSN